jgi:hypothetical protein
VLRLGSTHATEAVEHACRLVLESGDSRLCTVRGPLERAVQHLEPAPPTPSTPTAGAFLRGPETFAGYAGEVPA